MILLPDIRSAHNVGSIFRTADAAGVSKIYLSGTTPSPIDRFGRKRKDIAKVALGAEDTVPWEYIEDVDDAVARLQKSGVHICAIEQDETSIPYTAHAYTTDTLIIMGNEVDGIDKTLLKQADSILEIPMHGSKESLNVAVTTGIILFHAREYIVAHQGK